MLYIHIGLPKTGTTFLQEEVFPKWEGIQYYGKNKQFNKLRLNDITTINPYDKSLISDEDLSNPKSRDEKVWIDSYEKIDIALYNLSKMFPHAKIMICFRKHDSFIKSLYKQTYHRGQVYPCFESFFDIEDNAGDIKKEDISYKYYIKTIQKYFEYDPFVFLHEEMFGNLTGLLKDMAFFFGCNAPEIGGLKFGNNNKGVGQYQAEILSQLNKLFPSKTKKDAFLPYNKYTTFLGNKFRHFVQYNLFFLPYKEIKINKQQKRLINNYYKDDWDFIQNYIKYNCSSRYNFNI